VPGMNTDDQRTVPGVNPFDNQVVPAFNLLITKKYNMLFQDYQSLQTMLVVNTYPHSFCADEMNFFSQSVLFFDKITALYKCFSNYISRLI
jgi:hypothetical protein